MAAAARAAEETAAVIVERRRAPAAGGRQARMSIVRRLANGSSADRRRHIAVAVYDEGAGRRAAGTQSGARYGSARAVCLRHDLPHAAPLRDEPLQRRRVRAAENRTMMRRTGGCGAFSQGRITRAARTPSALHAPCNAWSSAERRRGVVAAFYPKGQSPLPARLRHR